MTILRGEWEQLRERPTRVLRFLAAAIALALFIWFVSHITTGWLVGFATRAGASMGLLTGPRSVARNWARGH